MRKISCYMDPLRLLCNLIEIPTVNPPGEHYEDMVNFLKKECEKIGLITKVYETPRSFLCRLGIKGGSRRLNLIAKWDVHTGKTLHINCHYDVVPASDRWKTGPFSPTLKNGRIYGRGAEDMKGNIAAILFAIKMLRKSKARPGLNIELSFTPDEEIGGRTGLGYLVDRELVKADYAIGEGYGGDYISIGNKGVLWAEIIVRGKSCHASVPHKGVNAFEGMLLLGRNFENLKKHIIKRKTRYPVRYKIAAHPTFVMGGLLEGGIKVNIVPDIVRFSIDRRLIPEESIYEANREIEEVVKRFNSSYKGLPARIKFSSIEPPAISRVDKPFFDVVSDAVQSVRGKRPRFCLMTGATDMRYFMWKGIPSIGYTVRGGEGWHSDDEFIYVDGLIEAAKIYSYIITNLR